MRFKFRGKTYRVTERFYQNLLCLFGIATLIFLGYLAYVILDLSIESYLAGDGMWTYERWVSHLQEVIK